MPQVCALAASGKSKPCSRASRLMKRGVSRSSRTWRRGAVAATARRRFTPTNELIRLRGDCGGTGTRPVALFSRKAFADGQAVWSWRPDAGAKSWSAQRALWDDGGKRARSPGRARSKPSTHRAGKAGCFRLSLWFLPRAFLFARGPRVSVDTRPSLHPLAIRRVLFPAKLGRHWPRERWRTPASGTTRD
jgi:hypothetical protein